MLWVVLLILLALVFGGVGLIVEALEFLLVLGLVLLLIAVGVGFWVRSKITGGT